MSKIKPKILIATPVHKSKDYAMAKWLQSVAQLQHQYPADLLLVDNSLGTSYSDKLKAYCQQSGVTNYHIKHLGLPVNQERFERMARSREIIRQYFLDHNYDVWFSWESDILIPPNALTQLVQLMQSGHFLVVEHNCWMRGFPGAYCTDFGIALVARKALEKYSFLLEFGTDPDMPPTYEPSEVWFKTRVLRDGGNCIEVAGVIDPIIHLNVAVSPKMKVLIGTPIHASKDYSMDRWLENVSRQEHPADLFLVDNSPGTDYMDQVRTYCAKHGITNYQIVHLDLPADQDKYERIARSREVIRQYFLAHDYDAWLTWECDQIIPNNTLEKLIGIMQEGHYLMVNPNKWAREDPTIPNTDFGCCLIKRQALQKYGFVNPPGGWETSEAWFKQRVLQGGGSYIDVYGVIDPIYHLKE